eukprot:591634-Rhodomonas_salina.1
MSVLDVRRAVNMRLLGWPLSLTKFSPQAGTPFNRWAHEKLVPSTGLRDVCEEVEAPGSPSREDSDCRLMSGVFTGLES